MSEGGRRGRPSSAALIESGPIRVKRGRHGLLAYSIHDTFVGRSIDLYGEWSPGDAQVLAPFLRPGMTVLDIGANLGSLTLFLADAVGPSGRVLAFEPVPALHRLLCCNLALNNLDQVEAWQTAIGRMGGEARVPELALGEPGNFGAAALARGGAGRSVPMLAVDDLDLAACGLIKADVEGHECEVLRGSTRTVARFRPVLFLENEEPSLSGPLIRQVLDLGYRPYWHSPHLFSPDNYFGATADAFIGLGSLNLLCLPAERDEVPAGLKPVSSPDEWPDWWPNWSRQPDAG